MTHDPMTHDSNESNPVVFIQGGHARATSQDVARYFSKRHANVVRNIRELLAEEAGLNRLTFELIEYVDERGRQQPAYSMDRDGFTLLAMGFTGTSALHFKWAYIQAFNAMEEKLAAARQNQSIQAPLFPDWPLEEVRAKTAVVEMYRRVYGPVAAQWSTAIIGFPIPPASMIEIGRQLLLDLRGGAMKEHYEMEQKAA